MVALSATLRAKPKWWIKIHDPVIRAKWEQEALAGPVAYGALGLTDTEVRYVLDEVAWYATQRDDATGIEVRHS